MKKVIFFTLVCTFINLLAPQSMAAPVQFIIDKTHQYIGFEASHFGFSPVRGRFDDVDITLMLDEVNPEKSKVNVVVYTKSIDTDHEPRDEHLRSADFFNVSQYPEMTFSSKSLVFGKDTSSGKIVGDLTLLGITKSITLDFKLTRDAPFPLPGYNNVRTLGFLAEGSIKRAYWGMDIYLGEAIADEVHLTIQFDAVNCAGDAAKAPSCKYGR